VEQFYRIEEAAATTLPFTKKGYVTVKIFASPIPFPSNLKFVDGGPFPH
jgi:hypothetical protein